jgi:cell division protein FtsQ
VLGVPRPLRAAVGGIRSGLGAVWERRRLRIASIGLLLALALLAGGWVWLRHSPLVSVEHVRVSGLEHMAGRDAGQIEAALEGATRGMSTLDVKTSTLRAAVASFPIVRSVRASGSFPHGLSIEVVEQPPVGAVEAGGVRTAVAADGVVLGSSYLSSSLPLVSVGRASAVSLPAAGGTIQDGSVRQALVALGAAPAALGKLVERVYTGPQGLTIVSQGGLLAYFGDDVRAHAKWLSLARVLADPSSVGAAYIDVRLPERPAAGFPLGATRPSVTGEAQSSTVSAPATAAELASGLEAAVGGGAGGSVSGNAPSGSSSAGEPVSSGSGPTESHSAEASSAGTSEAGSTDTTEAGGAGSTAPGTESLGH